MRIDTRLERQGLTPQQIFFIECWGNLSHKDSIDTDRVSFNNVLNALNEIKFLYSLGHKFSGAEKRSRAAEELLEHLEVDVVLQAPVFKNVVNEIKVLLGTREQLKDSGQSVIEKKIRLMESFFKQLENKLQINYIPIAVELTEDALSSVSSPTDTEYEKIANLCNSMISMLLTLGMPLSECYLIYQRTLLGRDGVDFNTRINSWKEKILSPIKKYIVKLTVENDRLYEMLIADSPPLIFNECKFMPFLTAKNRKATHIEIVTNAISVLAARNMADALLMESLDVITYMLGKSVVNAHNAFTVILEDGSEVNIATFDNEINVNSDRLTISEFSHFIKCMSTLYTNASPESVKKISSAFHFMRSGVSNKSKESRFTSFWSALESLTLGVSQNELAHDEHVIYSVVPCMGLDYIVKQLFALRGMLRYLKGDIVDAQNNNIDFSTVDLGSLYDFLKDPAVVQQIDSSFAPYPYARFMFKKLSSLCRDHRTMADKLIKHSEKVTLHIHRLYILRNAIVHNAGSSPYIELLTANLEHYLRATINAMFYTVAILPHLQSPEEAFTRYKHMYESMLSALHPAWNVKANKKAGVNKQVDEGQIKTDDNILCTWLKLHS